MGAVAVRHLKLVAPSEARFGAVQRIEEGLRLGAPAGERVLLIRHLRLGTLPLRAPTGLWTGRIEERLRAIAAAAVHGLSPGAGQAAAVWFHSIEEMLAALLGLIGRGERPSAWFWRTGVPAWDGDCSPASAARLLSALGGSPAGSVAAARTVLQLAATGHLAVIAAAIDPIMRPRLPRVAACSETQRGGRAADVDLAVRLLARLTPDARTGLDAALRGPAAGPLRAQWLVETALIAAAPEFTATPELLARTAAAWLAERMAALAPDGTPAGAASEPQTPRSSARASADSSLATGFASPIAQPVARKPVAPRNGVAGDDVDRSNAIDPPTLAKLATREQISAVAGVLLLIGPLVRLGFPAWLEARPALAAEGFGRALLCEIAVRHRAPPNDPVLTLACSESSATWGDALTAWRVGLDRWLRRRARIGLSEVVRKRGWLTLADDSIDARFAPAAADIRLRRLALDLDPGRVPWLGLTLRYHYCAEPLA